MTKNFISVGTQRGTVMVAISEIRLVKPQSYYGGSYVVLKNDECLETNESVDLIEKMIAEATQD